MPNNEKVLDDRAASMEIEDEGKVKTVVGPLLLEKFSDIAIANRYIQTQGTSDLKELEIIEALGKGGESIVFKAKLNKGNKYFAVKFVKKNCNKKVNANEFCIAKKLKDKNIAKILYYYASPNQPLDFIVMELGKTDLYQFCRKIIKRATLSETFLCYITHQVLRALLYLHKGKIAHLDIKPKNLIVTDFLDIKLIDFSVSLDYSNIKSKNIKLQYCGTSCMMAPEIIKTETIKIKDLNKLDMFSLGTTLYYLAFGEYPYNIQNEDSDDVIYTKIKSDWKVTNVNNYFSNYFIDFLNGLLNNDINKRMNIDEALNHYWIKGVETIYDEKENICNANIFLSYLITDHIRSFEEYIGKN